MTSDTALWGRDILIATLPDLNGYALILCYSKMPLFEQIYNRLPTNTIKWRYSSKSADDLHELWNFQMRRLEIYIFVPFLHHNIRKTDIRIQTLGSMQFMSLHLLNIVICFHVVFCANEIKETPHVFNNRPGDDVTWYKLLFRRNEWLVILFVELNMTCGKLIFLKSIQLNQVANGIMHWIYRITMNKYNANRKRMWTTL